MLLTLNNLLMKNDIVKMDQNPETGDWLCYIPNTGYAWYIKGKNKATEFCKEFNDKFNNNVIRLNEFTGKLEKVK
jgi:phage pi2 protein 07